LGAVAAPSGPRGIEFREIWLQCASPDTEHIAIHAAQHAAHQFAAAAGLTGNLLDWRACSGQCTDGLVALLTTDVALILKALGAGQQRWIDPPRAKRLPDLAH
jgi:hypothetical protein